MISFRKMPLQNLLAFCFVDTINFVANKYAAILAMATVRETEKFCKVGVASRVASLENRETYRDLDRRFWSGRAGI
jgi:hypothetical protein